MPAPTFLSLLKADASREQLEEWCRGKTQSYTVPFPNGSAVACRVLGKYVMYCAAADNALTPHLALDGIWEPWVTMAIARHVKPGMRCLDVGACYGYYALLLADIVGSAGHVQAWEPYWSHIVRTNASVNGLPIEVVGKAMATEEAEYRVTNPRGDYFFNAGDVKMRRFAGPISGSGATRRWSQIPTAEPWDFIKIDVEGAEADVWAALGPARTLSPNLTVCMEFTPSKHEDPLGFLDLLSTPYELGTVGHDGVPRRCSIEEALVPDTGDFRMLWLTKKEGA